MIIANRHGNIACTQGGESMAGLQKAIKVGHVRQGEVGVLDSTAHMLKFIPFQEMYFQDTFGPDFNVRPRGDLKNAPVLVEPKGLRKFPKPGHPLRGEDMKHFIEATVAEIARLLDLENR
jgi:threonine synthase